MFHPINLGDSCIIRLMYLEVCDSFNVSGRFVNLYIMIIIKDLLAFQDNGHYDCFMITITNYLLTFIDNGYYGYFMITIMKYILAFLDICIRNL